MNQHTPQTFDLEIDKWAALLGPIALVVFAYRAWRRRRARVGTGPPIG
jgi:hypothetical protein